MVWTDTNYNTITWSSTKFDSIFLGMLPYLTLSFGHSTKYSNMVWPDTNYNTITWSGTKCDSIFLGRLPYLTLSFGHSTKYSTLWFGLTPIITLSLGLVKNVIQYSWVGYLT